MIQPSPLSLPTRARQGIARVGQRAVHYGLMLAMVVLVADAIVGEKGVLALLEARREYRRVEFGLLKARGENAALREQARRLREEPAAIEELARRELGLIRPGERLFIIRDAPARP